MHFKHLLKIKTTNSVQITQKAQRQPHAEICESSLSVSSRNVPRGALRDETQRLRGKLMAILHFKLNFSILRTEVNFPCKVNKLTSRSCFRTTGLGCLWVYYCNSPSVTI